VHLGVTDIDQWSTSLVGYRAIRFTAALVASIKSSTLVPSSKTILAAPAVSNYPASFEYMNALISADIGNVQDILQYVN